MPRDPLPQEELEEVFGDDVVDAAHVVVEQLYEPVAMQWWAPTVSFLLDRADEARDLAHAP